MARRLDQVSAAPRKRAIGRASEPLAFYARPSRGEIWLVDFGAPDKRRPAVVLSRDVLIASLDTVIVAPVTSSAHGVETEVRLETSHGLQHESWANLTNVQTIRQSKLVRLVGSAPPEIVRAICRALAVATGCV